MVMWILWLERIKRQSSGHCSQVNTMSAQKCTYVEYVMPLFLFLLICDAINYLVDAIKCSCALYAQENSDMLITWGGTCATFIREINCSVNHVPNQQPNNQANVPHHRNQTTTARYVAHFSFDRIIYKLTWEKATHEERNQLCMYCNATFYSNYSRNRHIKRRHVKQQKIWLLWTIQQAPWFA